MSQQMTGGPEAAPVPEPAPTAAPVAPVTGSAAEANDFDISGPIVIGYGRTSFGGGPTFSYRDAQLTLSFSRDEITRTDSPVGELVTVTLEEVPDAFVRTFTLVVPKIHLTMGPEADFNTVGIETTDRSQAHTLPPGPLGVLQSYRLHELHGVARLVDF